MNAEHETREDPNELSLDFLKRFIFYARTTCAPRLSEDAAEKLGKHYVRMRNPPEMEGSECKGRLILILWIWVMRVERLGSSVSMLIKDDV